MSSNTTCKKKSEINPCKVIHLNTQNKALTQKHKLCLTVFL